MYSRQKSEGTSIVRRWSSSEIGLMGPNHVLNVSSFKLSLRISRQRVHTVVWLSGVMKRFGSGLVPTTKLGKKWWKKKLFFIVFFQNSATP